MSIKYERNQEASVYVGNLDERVSDELLWELMVQAGPVVSVHVPKDRVTQMNQGFGFVEFQTCEDAEYAIKIMNMVRLFGKPLRVNMAASDKKVQDVGAKLFVGNLDPDVDEKMLYDTMSAFGQMIQPPSIARDQQSGNSKGFAFVSYATFEAADWAIQAMNGQYLANKPITASYAFKKDAKGERHGSAAERLLAAQAAKNNPQLMHQHQQHQHQHQHQQHFQHQQPPPAAPGPFGAPAKMERMRTERADNVRLTRSGCDNAHVGTLEMTEYHLVFTAHDGLELRIGYPMIHSAVLERPSQSSERLDAQTDEGDADSARTSGGEAAIRLRCHNFMFVDLHSENERQLYDAFAAMKQLACVPSVKRLYAFAFPERYAGGNVYDARAEFARMGVESGEAGRHWRFSEANRGFGLCATYPPVLVVPARISDTTLTYAARHRSKGRLPVLSYLHTNGASITRSSQPMVGLKQARSVQDEKLVEAILASSEPQGTPPRFDYQRNHIIIDARPTTNAVANRAVGAGSENMDHYKRCRKVYLGIDNIHVMRDALDRLVVALQDTGERRVARLQSAQTRWLGHIQNILVGVRTIVEAVQQGNHAVVHCSDGWDRTAQLTSLAQLCLDPFYRTLRGFAVLVEKEWVSFGHQFTLRCGHTGHPARFTVTRAARPKRGAGDSSDRENDDSSSVQEESDLASNNDGDGFDALLQTGSMFGRFASRAFRGVQSRISSAIQAANDDESFFTAYPELQSNYSAQSKDGRSGSFSIGRSSKHDHETSPVFHQFLDCVYQLWIQNPTMFEFGERFLLDLFYHLHAAQFGTFLANNMKERQGLDLANSTQSIWPWILDEKQQELRKNNLYGADEAKRDSRTIVPDTQFLRYWTALFECHDSALAGLKQPGAATTAAAADAPTGVASDSKLAVPIDELTQSGSGWTAGA
ncbi:phosphatidylinositol-3-phosphatase ymr1 [Coemansia biformis]|uniref:Splicing factor 3B subunit 4 n=1 Tax=Coemansia biformis TaxID=1286918 RepID=A0A9W7Y8S6_9FUNG|nr:phosphatidylinositol-3-phosphatase ymr1 [Coemansia biformis]